MSKKNVIIVEERKPDLHGDSVFEVELEPGVEASPIRWSGQSEPRLWSLTLTHVSGLQVVVRERVRGTIELESEFIDRRGGVLTVKPLVGFFPIGFVSHGRARARMRNRSSRMISRTTT